MGLYRPQKFLKDIHILKMMKKRTLTMKLGEK